MAAVSKQVPAAAAASWAVDGGSCLAPLPLRPSSVTPNSIAPLVRQQRSWPLVKLQGFLAFLLLFLVDGEKGSRLFTNTICGAAADVASYVVDSLSQAKLAGPRRLRRLRSVL